MKLKTIFFLTTIFLITFTGCGEKGSGSSGSIVVNTINGDKLDVDYSSGKIEKFKNIKLEGVENKILFLSFFSTTCQPCRDEIPYLINLQNKYKDDFEIIGVLTENKQLNEIKDFVELFGINYKITDSGEDYSITNLVGGVKGVPTMFMYDKNGEYVTHYIGAVPQAMIENDIKKVLSR